VDLVTRHLINYSELEIVVRIRGGKSSPEGRYRFWRDTKGLHMVESPAIDLDLPRPTPGAFGLGRG
jgi:hypothetical protein